jgi:hypothetical protein
MDSAAELRAGRAAPQRVEKATVQRKFSAA